MSDICQWCTLKITANQQKITCANCSRKYHINCMNLTSADVLYLQENKGKWQCTQCNQTARKFRNASSSSPTDTTKLQIPTVEATDYDEINSGNTASTLKKIVSQLNTILAAQTEAATSINLCHEKIDELNDNLKKMGESLAECVKKTEHLETKVAILEKENIEIRGKLNECEQYSRRNALEIQGVPEAPGENVLTVVKDVATSIGFKLEDNMIDACHRLRKNVNRPDQVRGIIIKFVRRLDKEEFLRLKKIKRELKVSNLHPDFRKLIKQDNYIYVNESLTTSNKILYSKAREFKKQNNIKYLWTRNGKILMRANDTSQVYEIKSCNDFNDVH